MGAPAWRWPERGHGAAGHRRDDEHHTDGDHRRAPAPRGPGPGRARPARRRAPAVHLPQDGGGPGRVLVPQGDVVVVGQLAGVVLALEVAQRAEQEVPLLVQLPGGPAHPAGAGGHDFRAWSTSAWSATVTRRPGRTRLRRSTTVRPATAAATPSRGRAHTSRPRPLCSGLRRMAVVYRLTR